MATTSRASVRRVGAALAALLLLALLAPARPALALPVPIPIAVTTTSITDAADGGCSLYEALNAAFNQKLNGGKVTDNECVVQGDQDAPVLITFAGSAAGAVLTANPAWPLPFINRNVTLTGPVILDGGGKSPNPSNQYLLRIAAGGTLTLAGLTVRNGYTAGSGSVVLDDAGGTLNLLGVSVLNNVAENDGGAIYSNGTVNIAGSAFTGNKALGVANGGDNPGTGYGGAILMSGGGTLNVSLTAFTGNTARQGGGALFSRGKSATLSDTAISGNVVTGSGENNGGGAIYLSGLGGGAALALQRVALSANLALSGSGGALFSTYQTTAVISDTSFNGNIAGDPFSSSGASLGGAIYNQHGDVQIGRSVFIANVSAGTGGAILNDRAGTLTVANTQFFGSLAKGDTSAGGTLWNGVTVGGGSSTAVLKNVTIAQTSAKSADAIFNQAGGSVSLGNTIVSGGAGACAGTITSLGHNIDEKDSCKLTQEGDRPNTDPKLDTTPSFNGGPLNSLLTQKLGSDSPAIDAGDPAVCAASPVGGQDVRGKDRPKDGDGKLGALCDIGAFENDTYAPGYGSTPVQPGPLTFGSAVASQGSTSAVLQIFNTGNAPLKVDSPAISGPAAADFAIDPNLSLTISDSTPQPVTLTCAPKGIGSRTATLLLHSNDPANTLVSYSLECTGTAAPAPGFLSSPAAPGPLDLGTVFLGQQASAKISVKNSGNLDLALSGIALGGLNAAEFSVAGGAQPVAPGATSDLTVQCQPAGAGVRIATLSFATNDAARPSVSYNLSCAGAVVPPPPLALPGQALAKVPGAGASGTYGLAMSPDGKSVYAVDGVNSAVSLFSRNTFSGALTFQASYVNGQGGVSGIGGAYMATVSPDGKFVYVAGRSSASLAVFSRDALSGALTFQSKIQNGDVYSCILDPCNTISGLSGAYGLAISPDGEYLYVSSISESAILVIRRNTTTGSLKDLLGVSLVQKYTSADLTGAYGIALSPDAQNLYATGYSSDTLLVFRRSAASGALSHLTTIDKTAVPSLNGVFRVAVSPDGASLYAASFDANAVTAFRRSTGDGSLTYLESYANAPGGFTTLGFSSAVAVSPDGAWVYSTAYSDDALNVFARDPQSGRLALKQAIQRDAGGQPPLDGARDVLASPDGRTVVATGYLDNRVTAFQISNPAPTLGSLSPASVKAGAGDLALTVGGADFVPGAALEWDGAAQGTAFVSANKLTAVIPAALLAAPGSHSLRVVNPAPAGGPSNTLGFVVVPPDQNPLPSLSELVPQSAQAGAAGFTLTVSGSSFTAGSVVQWNGASRPTTFISPSKLQALVTAADVAQPGAAGVTVLTPGPGGGSSNAAAFTVSAPGQIPAPSITIAAPLFASAGDTSFTLTVEGSSFTESSVVQWDGETRPTTFVSPTRLEAAISGADVAAAGQASVTVFTPAPGGGTSNPVTFTVGALGDNPVPALTDAALAIGPGTSLTVTVSGSDVVAGATVLWNGAARTPTQVAPTQVSFTISAAEYARGPAVINVVNPAPGGGVSNDLLLQIQRLYLPAAKK